jgi:serine/threonine-protein kinase
MATVYLARDLKHDREVALKVLRDDLSAVIGSERFLSEIRIVARLDHPHILTLIDSGSADGALYYVLPFVRGESLRAKLHREKQLDVQESLSIITQVASALDYAHGQGVIHRDIKPENILLHEGEAVLADFGIALAVKEAGGNRLTETGLSLGTPQYMSPEQATGDRDLDRRSDVYSLGAVFYEMIAGEPPVTGANAQSMIAKLLTEKPVRLRVIRDSIPLAMDRATEKALAKVPVDRFKTAGEFARALASAMPESEELLSRKKWLWPAAAAAAIAIIALGFWITRAKSGKTNVGPVSLRERTQITNTGGVSLPAISGDGKTIAYVATDCRETGCRYSIDMQDVAGGPSRRLVEGASAIYGIEMSPDRRNVIFTGSINRVYGSFIVSTLGGAPRQLASFTSAFYAGGDSLLQWRSSKPAAVMWILVSGLDGVPTDSIRVEGPAAAMASIASVPNSRRIMYALVSEKTMTWFSSDRTGARYSSKPVMLGFVQPGGAATADALWIQTGSPGSVQRASIVRIPFDASTGKFAAQGDTVHTGTQTSFGITADGGTLVFDERITEYGTWALSFADFMKGKFSEERRILRGTSPPRPGISADGNAAIVVKDGGAGAPDDREWSIIPLSGGEEIRIPGRHFAAIIVDSTTAGLGDAAPSGIRLSLFDYRTKQSRATISVPNSGGHEFIRLRGREAWAWITADGRSINVQRDGDKNVQRIALPISLSNATTLVGSPDGGTIAFVGWNAPRFDSLGVGMVSLSDGKVRELARMFGETGRIWWLNDGSIGLALVEATESFSIYRVRPGKPIEHLGNVPRPIGNVTMSGDMKRAIAVTRDFHGDAWMSKVVK